MLMTLLIVYYLNKFAVIQGCPRSRFFMLNSPTGKTIVEIVWHNDMILHSVERLQCRGYHPAEVEKLLERVKIHGFYNCCYHKKEISLWINHIISFTFTFGDPLFYSINCTNCKYWSFLFLFLIIFLQNRWLFLDILHIVMIFSITLYLLIC